MKLLYFAWLRQKIGRGEEQIDVPASIETAEQLVTWLRARGAEYANAFAEQNRVRVAINQVHADLSARVTNRDEVAFFPPVTGG